MELKMVRGCTCDSLTVNGVEEVKLDDEERREVIKKIFETIEPKDLNYLLQWYLETFGDYECDDKPCECCGDCVEQYNVDI